jgi:ribosomal protein L34E
MGTGTTTMTSGQPASACARCGGAFHCGVNDPSPCACTTVRLEPSTLQQLRRQFSGCLCLACLRQFSEGAAPEEDPAGRRVP